MYRDFRERADFYVVYIAEAHAVDEWKLTTNEQADIRIPQATRFEERLAAARRCAAELGLTIPTVVDGMDNAAFEAFSAWPERIYIVDGAGAIHYRGGPGPYGFNPAEARESLVALLGQK